VSLRAWRATGLVLACSALGACTTVPSSLYAWGDYPQALTQHLRSSGGDAARQVALLEAQLQRPTQARQAVPPGLHAHLALLHTQLGNEAVALRHLEAEKQLFPESAPYMDFLLRSARQARQAHEGRDPAQAEPKPQPASGARP